MEFDLSRSNFSTVLPHAQDYALDCDDPTTPSTHVCWDRSTLRTNQLDQFATRAIFINVFLTINVFIPVVGTLFIKRLNQYRVLNNRPIPLRDLVPWTSVASGLHYLKDTRRLPAGSLAFVMLFIGALQLATSNILNFSIRGDNRAGRCAYGRGLRFDAGARSPGTPYADWPASTTAVNAQVISYGNLVEYSLSDTEQKIGIYNYASAEPSFYALPNDTLAWWKCHVQPSFQDQASTDLILNQTSQYQDILTALANVRELDQWNYTVFADVSDYSPDSLVQVVSQQDANSLNTTSFFAWTPRMPDDALNPYEAGQVWGVDIVTAYINSSNSEDVFLTPIRCAINGSDTDGLNQVNDVIRVMFPVQSLSDYTDQVSAAIDGSRDPPAVWATQVELRLNAMVMMYASGNGEVDIPFGKDPILFNCIIPDTIIRVEVFVVMGVLILALVGLCSAAAYLTIWNRSNSTKDQKIDIHDMPNDMVSLQLAMIREKEKDKDAKKKAKDLKNYTYTWNHDSSQLVFVGPQNSATSSGDGFVYHEVCEDESECSIPKRLQAHPKQKRRISPNDSESERSKVRWYKRLARLVDCISDG